MKQGDSVSKESLEKRFGVDVAVANNHCAWWATAAMFVDNGSMRIYHHSDHENAQNALVALEKVLIKAFGNK